MKTYSCSRGEPGLFPVKFLLILLITQLSFPILAQTAESYRWGNVAIGDGGFVSGIITSNTGLDLMYARTDVGGAYRWDAPKERWIPLLTGYRRTSWVFLAWNRWRLMKRHPNNVYILAGISYFNSGRMAILKSTNYGETFSVIDVTNQFRAHGNGMGRQTGEKLQVDPNSNNILYTGTRWNGLFKSTDYGESWTRLIGLNVTTTPNENGISFVVLDSDSTSGPTQTLFVGVSRTGTNLYRSNNAGQSFTAISGGPTDLMPLRAELSTDGFLYITYANGAGPRPDGFHRLSARNRE